MNRLVHDYPSTVRSCQMSKSDFFCFVEGVENDSFFYNEISAPLFKLNGLKHEFIKSNALTNGLGGGKSQLLHYFEYLRNNKLLSADFKGKKTSFVFFLDKDIDDLDGSKLRSKHLTYTEHYDIQNYLFLHGDLIKTAAAAASLPLNILSASMGHPQDWLASCANSWKEWIVFCALFKRHKINYCGYGAPSNVNNPSFGPHCITKSNIFKNLAIVHSGLTTNDFNSLFNETSNLVNSFYLSGKTDKVFKGKWYLAWLSEHLRNTHGVSVSHKQLATGLSVSLNFQQKWTTYLKKRLKALILIH